MKIFFSFLTLSLTFSSLVFAEIFDWDQNKDYNAGVTVVVKEGDNAGSYRSLQSVSAGTPITSTDFWYNLFLESNLPDYVKAGENPDEDGLIEALSGGTPNIADIPEELPPNTDTSTGGGDTNTDGGDTSTGGGDTSTGGGDTSTGGGDTDAEPDSRLINLSTRGFVGTRSTDQHMVGGFFVNGSDDLKVFVKCNGPTLGQLGVVGAIADLRVTIKKFPSEEVVLENDNWNSSDTEWSEIKDTYQPLTSLDAAAFVTLSPGLYTTEVEGVSGATGNGQIEIFTYRELEKKSSYSGNDSLSNSRLINLSTRGFVGTRSTDQHMVGGFFVNGSDDLKVFVKCNGPTLGQLGVVGAIADLKVTIKKFPSEEVVLENDNWNSSDTEWSEIKDTYKPLTPLDAAAFVTLSPGLYTTEVEGVSGATGNGQIEIFTYRELERK